MASILAPCAACSREFRLDARHAGREVACPHCGKTVRVAAAPAAPATDRLVGKEIGGCRLVRRLGAGALGVVYEGADPALGAVAVKLLGSKAAEEPEVVARFAREATLAEGLRHPNVVAVHRHGFDRGVHWMVMEFVPGGTLAGLAEDGRMPWAEAFALVRQAAEGVAALHAQGILHRDIKPANILYSDAGGARVAKLADLGLAKDQAAEGTALTMQGVALGSPAYMPPEQILDAKSVTAAADVYALGATLYQLIAGRLPFTGRGGAAMMGAVLRDPPLPLGESAEVPAGVEALIMACLAKEPGQRPPDAAALVAAIDRVAADPGRAPAAAAPASPPRRRARWPWLVAAAVAVAAIAAIAIVLRG